MFFSKQSQSSDSSWQVATTHKKSLRWLRFLVAGKRKFITLVVLFLALGIMAVLIPKQVTFSYAHETCISRLTFFPNTYRVSTSTKFTVRYVRTYSAAVATKTCFAPTAAPSVGEATVTAMPFGLTILQSSYRLSVGEAPRVLMPPNKNPVALSKPIKLQLSQPDAVFTYQIEVAGKTQACAKQQAELSCKFDKLGLEQGKTHQISLARIFHAEKVGEVGRSEVAILPAVVISGSTLQNNETVYAKPKSVTLTANKPLTAATARLELLDGSAAVAQATQTKVDGRQLIVSWPNDLPREKSFKLTLVQAQGIDGSTLAEPYLINFKTSGGPKVTGVNIGSSRIAGNTRVIVNFDQPLAANIDIAKFAHIAGGGAAISYAGNQVIFSLQNIPRCTGITFAITSGLTGESGVVSTTQWTYASRVSCRATQVIGYSVKGRPIYAYYFGSGSKYILFTGGMHGSEPSGSYIMQDWADYLDSEAYRLPADKQIVIVPNVNPDGLAANNRLNANNVNIDRNFPESDWTTDIVTSGGEVSGGGGSAPLSEPEAKALANLTSSLRPRLEVSYHSRGSLVGSDEFGDANAIGARYAAAVGYRTMFDNAEAIMGYSFTGEYEGWMAETGIPAILIELPSDSGHYFSRHKNAIWNLVGL